MEAAPGLDRLGAFVNRRALRAFGSALQPGEAVSHVLEATHGKRGVLAVTDRRLLFVAPGLLFRSKAEWRHGGIAGVELAKAVDDAVVTVVLRVGAPVPFTGCRKREAEAFVKAVRERPPGPDDPLDFTPAELKPKTERQMRRERLERMYRKGTMTKAEYERSLRSLDAE
ncbi:MAG TPA: PH domain-containing protein [Candidatus Thermoplasmatota archaeon]|nr:PH domain-containing protein [Candidatus Thermoplasmatota archaeon]